jgi:hypothetical protein
LEAVRNAKLALVMSLVLMVAVAALTLTHAPLRVVRVSTKAEEILGTTTSSPTTCQPGEVLPSGVSAVRLGIEASFGPKMLLRAYSGSRVIAEGSRAANWTGTTVTFPIKPLSRTASAVKLCFYVGANSEFLRIYGAPGARDAARGAGGEPLPGKLKIEYLAPGQGSWWSSVEAVARHIGVGRALSGTWLALLLALLSASVVALMIWLAWWELP